METSKNQSMNNNTNVFDEDQPEESGWTAYLEDFSCPNNGSFISSPSLVSDAAWNGLGNGNMNHQMKRLKFKNVARSKNRRYEEDDLEDTASSPVNSPKVSNMKPMEVNYRRFEEAAMSNFMGKPGAGQNNFSELGQDDDKNGQNIRNLECVDLKKRGLCLVPVSAFMNYLG